MNIDMTDTAPALNQAHPSPIHITVRDDGAYDLSSGGIRLKGCRPGMDDGSIIPANVTRREQDGRVELRYALEEGEITLTLRRIKGGLAIDSVLTGMDRAPHWFSPLHSARVAGAARFFRQGLGFSGPTNFIELDDQRGEFGFESYMIGAFEATDRSAVVIHSEDHRNFLPQTRIYNRIRRCEFRNRRVAGNTLFLESGFSTEHVPVPETGLVMPTLFVTAAVDTESGVRAAAMTIAERNQARVPSTAKYFYCSWYDKYFAYDRNDLQRTLDGIRTRDVRVDAVQIDDGYQIHWGDWLTTNRGWPEGLAEAAAAIRATGREAGIWVAPMAAEKGGDICRHHPDWLLKDREGKPIVKMVGDHIRKVYQSKGLNIDGRDFNDRYALDLSHPGVIEHIRHTFATLREWGFTYYKTDFMDWGYADSVEVQRHTPGKTSAMWFDLALRTLREAIGTDSYWLACISYFPPFVGYCDAMRVASDVGPAWNKEGGAGNDGVGGGVQNMIEESCHTQYFNNILWQNDPDVIYLRDHHIQMSDAEIRSMALWVGMLGGVVNTSDFFDALPEERVKLWKFLEPGDKLNTARVPSWGRKDMALHILIKDFANGSALFVLNPAHAAKSASITARELFGSETMTLYEWKLCEVDTAKELSRLDMTLESHHSLLYWVGANPPRADRLDQDAKP